MGRTNILFLPPSRTYPSKLIDGLTRSYKYTDLHTLLMDPTWRFRGKLFGFDSKTIYKEWVGKDGTKLRLKIPVGVCIHTTKNEIFEEEYEKILSKLFLKFKIKKERHVYDSSEIGRQFPPDSEEFAKFCLGFTREIMKLEDTKFTFFVTTINKKYLKTER